MTQFFKALVIVNYGLYITPRHFHKFFSSFLIPSIYSKALAWYSKQDAVNLDKWKWAFSNLKCNVNMYFEERCLDFIWLTYKTEICLLYKNLIYLKKASLRNAFFIIMLAFSSFCKNLVCFEFSNFHIMQHFLKYIHLKKRGTHTLFQKNSPLLATRQEFTRPS